MDFAASVRALPLAVPLFMISVINGQSNGVAGNISGRYLRLPFAVGLMRPRFWCRGGDRNLLSFLAMLR